jgi:vacuolar-type H+-ATPase subunit H
MVKEEAAAPAGAGGKVRTRESKEYTKGKSKSVAQLEKAVKRFLNYYKLKVKDLNEAREYIIDAAKANDASILEEKDTGALADEQTFVSEGESKINKINIKIMIPMKNYDNFVEMINKNEKLEVVSKEMTDAELSEEFSNRKNKISKKQNIELLIVDIELTL